MPNIIDILARALSLRQETELNSITPNRAGGIMYDTLLVLNQMQLEGGALLISKVYASVAAMEADTTPTSDLTGRALKPGQLVVIVTTNSSSSDMGSEYRYNGPGSWTYVGKVGGLPFDTVPIQNSTKGITSGGVYTALMALKNEGYKYMGIATPGSEGTTPSTPYQPVFYVAGPGSYPNFGSITVASGYLGFLKYSSGSWTVESVAVGKDYDSQLSTIEGQITQLVPKVDALDALTLSKTTIDPMDFDIRSRQIQSNGTYSNGTTYKHTLVPVKEGDIYLVTAGAAHSAQIAWLTSNAIPASGDTAAFVPDTSRIDITAGDSVLFTVPSGAKYMYVYLGTSANDYDFTPSVIQRLDNSEESNVNDINDALGLDYIQVPVDMSGSVEKLYISDSAVFTSVTSSSYIIAYWSVSEETKFRVQQSISGASVAIGRIGCVDSVNDIVANGYMDFLKKTGAKTADYDTIVTVPAGKVMVVSANSSAIPTVKKIVPESERIVEIESFLKTALPKYPKRGVNLIQADSILENTYTQANGQYHSGNGYCAFEIKFPVDGMRLYMNKVFAGYYCIFDKDGNILDSGGSSSSDRKFYSGYKLPTGAVRGRFTSQNTKAAILASGYVSYYHCLTESEISNRVSYDESYTNIPPGLVPSDYSGRDMSTFKKICCIGDSLTAGVLNSSGAGIENYGRFSYPTYLAEISGTETVNMGRGGYSTKQWWDAYQNDERLTGIDCAIIQLGVNDTVADWDTDSVPSFINIVNKLKTNNPGIIIFLSGIINAQSYKCAQADDGVLYTKDQGIRTLYQSEWENDNQVFFLDWAKWGHLRDLKANTYATDLDNYNSGHLSAYGYNRLAQDYYNYIGWIMHNDDQLFRNIQFTGTNQSYP